MIRGISRDGWRDWDLRSRFPVKRAVLARESQYYGDLWTVAGGGTAVRARVGIEGVKWMEMFV